MRKSICGPVLDSHHEGRQCCATPMRDFCTNAGRWIVIAAMLAAFGGHWAALQTVAWAAMVYDNVKQASLGDALERTFDGQHPCPLCKTIEKGRQSEKQQDALTSIGKIDFFYQASGVALLSRRPSGVLPVDDVFAEERGRRPILQPPRIS